MGRKAISGNLPSKKKVTIYFSDEIIEGVNNIAVSGKDSFSKIVEGIVENYLAGEAISPIQAANKQQAKNNKTK